MKQPQFVIADPGLSTEWGGSAFEHAEAPSKARALILCVCVVATLLTYLRLYFGVDLDDEAFHVAVSYRNVIGARPFVDEIYIPQQGAGMLVSPFVGAYYHLFGLGGIVLFSRHIYFLLSVCAMTIVFLSLRALLNNALLALSCSLMMLVFIPNNLPSPNYNSLANAFFGAGCFLGLAYARQQRRRYVALSGLLHGLAIFSYPTLVTAVAAYAVALYFVSRSRTAVRSYVVAASLLTLAWLAVLVNDGAQNALSVIRLSREVAAKRDVGLDRAVTVIHDAVVNFPLAPVALAGLVAVVLWQKRRPGISVALLSVLPIFALPVRRVDLTLPAAPSHYVANLGLLAVPLGYALWSSESARTIMIGVWIPAFVAGLTISWSTFGGGGQQGIGFAPAAIAAVALLALGIRLICRQRDIRLTSAAPFLPPLVAVGALVVLQFSSAFHDRSPLRLHTRIASGAYAGLLTTPETARLVTTLTRDLQHTSDSRCNVLFYYDFPAGFLLSLSKPYTNTVWLSDLESLRTLFVPRLLKYYATIGRTPDVAVRIRRIPFLVRAARPRYQPGDALDALVMSPRYERVARRNSYSIYVRRSGPCAST
jgi:hypothetical protein